jgi:hypothetical protein
MTNKTAKEMLQNGILVKFNNGNFGVVNGHDIATLAGDIAFKDNFDGDLKGVSFGKTVKYLYKTPYVGKALTDTMIKDILAGADGMATHTNIIYARALKWDKPITVSAVRLDSILSFVNKLNVDWSKCPLYDSVVASGNSFDFKKATMMYLNGDPRVAYTHKRED